MTSGVESLLTGENKVCFSEQNSGRSGKVHNFLRIKIVYKNIKDQNHLNL